MSPAPSRPHETNAAGESPGADSRADFARRHIGPDRSERTRMLAEVGFDDMASLLDAVVPRVDPEPRTPRSPRGGAGSGFR
ncbi:MAG: hypothetical protein R2789_07630 [Microthrixaceae bacterium]